MSVPKLSSNLSFLEDTFQYYQRRVYSLIYEMCLDLTKIRSYFTKICSYQFKSQHKLHTMLTAHLQIIKWDSVWIWYLYFEGQLCQYWLQSYQVSHICAFWCWYSHITSSTSYAVCDISQLWPWTWHIYAYILEEYHLVWYGSWSVGQYWSWPGNHSSLPCSTSSQHFLTWLWNCLRMNNTDKSTVDTHGGEFHLYIVQIYIYIIYIYIFDSVRGTNN